MSSILATAGWEARSTKGRLRSGVEITAPTSIIQYWHSGDPPGDVRRLIATFRDRNPQMRHRLFDEAAAANLIATHFGSREAAAFGACAVPAMQADYFRYCALYALGGVYADAGFCCSRSLCRLVESAATGTLFRRDPHDFLLNGFFIIGARHPLLRLTLDVATANVEQRPVEMVQMITGPWIFSALAALHRLGSEVADEPAGDTLETLKGPLLREALAFMPTPVGREAVWQMVSPLLETVGDYRRIAEAFEGIRIEPYAQMTEYVRPFSEPLPHKRTESDWIKWQSRGQTIFR